MERRLARTLADHDTSRVALSKELHDAKHERNLTITQLRHLEKYGATLPSNAATAAATVAPEPQSQPVSSSSSSPFRAADRVSVTGLSADDSSRSNNSEAAENTARLAGHHSRSRPRPPAAALEEKGSARVTSGALLSRRLDHLAAISRKLLDSDSDGEG